MKTETEILASERRNPCPIVVTRGAVSVRIYPTAWRQYQSFTLAYVGPEGRRREKRNTLERAKARARQIAGDVLAGGADQVGFTAVERVSYRRAMQLLPAGVDLETAVAEYVRGLGLGPKTKVETLAGQLLDELKAPGCGRERSGRWLRTLEQQLGVLGQSFGALRE